MNELIFFNFHFYWNPIAISPTKSNMSKGKRIKTIVFHQEEKKCTNSCVNKMMKSKNNTSNKEMMTESMNE